MPKKFAGTNSKAEAARARKTEKTETERARKKAAEEDSKWVDDDKANAKKKERREEAERKRLEALEKRKERQQLEEEEQKALKSGKNQAQVGKVTRNQIRLQREEEKLNASLEEKRNESKTHLELELEDNLNRVSLEAHEAKDVDQALQVLGSSEKAKDRHPEKRMKAAFEEFERTRLPELKSENPNLRLSQLKQILRKEWMKHPSNPFNQIG